ncbi:hypothetical protein G6L28_03310 [Agrobacterium larrymoorei]|uniref:hypothetical protein n=1 Tax=Agrobacterium larrymoorei TaxID=160699 RepID=UPI00157367E6|nr:hypothetical protein [Agrobacterium larrymoorei]NTJ41627.1 hypothetical protein [Agrobacterium larrymoorei]
MESTAEWSEELDALRFSVPGHGALCAMHRLAFKTLLLAPPDASTCLEFFERNRQVFIVAATRKIERLKLPADRSLHLNSRDIRRAMSLTDVRGPSRACRVLDR